MPNQSFTFQKWSIYQKGQAFVKKCHEITGSKEVKGQISAVDQLRRASLSIVLNIAEGAGRYGVKDKMKFYRTARGSLFECIAVIDFLHNVKAIDNSTHSQLNALGTDIGRMATGLMRKLEELGKGNKN